MLKREAVIEWTAVGYDELDASDLELVEKAREYMAKSYSPYSGFKVGAALRLANGAIVGGTNQENAAYPSGLCAERVALFAAATQYPQAPPVRMSIVAMQEGGKEVVDIPVSPCGGCRETFVEIARRYKRDFDLLLCGRNEVIRINALALMPLVFNLPDEDKKHEVF